MGIRIEVTLLESGEGTPLAFLYLEGLRLPEMQVLFN